MRTIYGLVSLLCLMACSDSTDSDDTGPGSEDDSGSAEGGESEGSSGGGDEGGDEGGDDGGGGGTTAFEPTAGEWNFVDGALLSDSCDYDYEQLPSGGDGFMLNLLGEPNFEVLLDGTEEGFRCSWDDAQGFLCDVAEGAEELDDLSATISSQTVLSGVFPDESSMTSTYNISVDCEGDDCSWVEFFGEIEFPCTVEVELIAEAAK